MAVSKTAHVRRATEADIPAMASLMGEIFRSGDAIAEFVFPDERQRQVRLPQMFAAVMKHRYIPDGGADVAIGGQGKIVGVALSTNSWTRPTPRRRIREGLALLAAMKTRVFTGLTVHAAQARGKPPQRHIYLMYLCTDQSRYGREAAHALIRRLRQHADAQAAALYCNCPRTLLHFYSEAFPDGGVSGTTTLGRGGPALYFLYCERVC